MHFLVLLPELFNFSKLLNTESVQSWSLLPLLLVTQLRSDKTVSCSFNSCSRPGLSLLRLELLLRDLSVFIDSEDKY